MAYSTPTEVINFTGIRPEDFSLETLAELESIIEVWLKQVKSLIDNDRNRDYEEEVAQGERGEIPPGIHHIALRMAANIAAQAQLRRETPIVRVDDLAPNIWDDTVFTDQIKSDLARFPYKRNFKFIRVLKNGEEEEQ